MRKPTEMELDGLRIMVGVAMTHRRSAGVNSNPAVLAAEAWCDEVLQTAELCQDWPVDLDQYGCAACLGEHDRLCTIAEQRDMRIQVSREYEQPAPKACPLRAGVSFIVRAE